MSHKDNITRLKVLFFVNRIHQLAWQRLFLKSIFFLVRTVIFVSSHRRYIEVHAQDSTREPPTNRSIILLHSGLNYVYSDFAARENVTI